MSGVLVVLALRTRARALSVEPLTLAPSAERPDRVRARRGEGARAPAPRAGRVPQRGTSVQAAEVRLWGGARIHARPHFARECTRTSRAS